METVHPITDPNLIQDIADYLKKQNHRDYVLFCMGIYTGLRIADILKLQVRHVKGQSHLRMREGKTQKRKIVKISPQLSKILEDYVKNKEEYEYLFKSRMRGRTGANKPISRERAYSILRCAAKEFGLKHIGCHSMRKTFGYWMYSNSKGNIALLMDLFNHSKEEITLRYIGLNQQNKDKAIDDLDFGV